MLCILLFIPGDYAGACFIGFAIGATLIFNTKDYFPRRVVLEPDNVMILGLIVLMAVLVKTVGA